MTKYSVRRKDGELYLDMTLDQRSSDYIMANYINKIQYVALQMMIASHCGFKLGKFCHLVQNLHIYDRHFDAVKELLDRDTLTEQPYIELNINKSFYDITIDDFTVKNIKNIKKLPFNLEIAI
jgi:thymidylate synthase